MEIKNISIFIFLVLLTSCSDNENKSNYLDDGFIRFNGFVQKTNLAFSESEAEWSNCDAIGVYIKESGKDLSTNVLQNNIKYITYDGEGKFNVAQSSQPAVYPVDGSSVDIIGYHPYRTIITNYEYKVDLTNQSNQADLDLLYSDNIRNQSKGMSGDINLLFTHELTKIIVNVSAGTGITDLTGLTTVVAGTKARGQFNLSNGTLVPDNASEMDILLDTQLDGSIKARVEGILLPSTASAGRSVIFYLNDKIFQWDIPDNTVFMAGAQYMYEAILNKEEVLMINPNATITDWDNLPIESIKPEVEDAAPVITINLTNNETNGLPVGTTSVNLKGSVSSVNDLVSAQVIMRNFSGVETVIDLMSRDIPSDGIRHIVINQTIPITNELCTMLVKASDSTGKETVSEELQIAVGYSYFNLYATASGNGADGLFPFFSAALGKMLDYCDAGYNASLVDIAFASYGENKELTITNIAQVNSGKFKHPTCSPSTWNIRTTVPLAVASNIKRSNFDASTIEDIRAEKALTTGGAARVVLTNASFTDMSDIACLYQIQINGENKRVVLSLDRLDMNMPQNENVGFWIKVKVEK